ncbi:ABC transporter permease [Brevibacillus ruminantium]|uniref:Transport permease protein n=1 Tax=Brevibacillus ruminantium TaxID=2950604 RepID=A0ABY4WHS0_9BACL|nr:ABC transporter permease [Brevibacillus ruminantium]USG66603.1 ABC transporter permease [Brevibacillus ruminantium]
MREMMWLIRKTLTDTFRKKSSWFVYFGLPIVGILISMFLYSNISSGTIRVGISNQDGNQAITMDVIRFMEGLNQLTVTVTDEQSLHDDIASGKLDSGIIFEPGFAASVREGKPDHLNIVSVKGRQVTAYIKAMLQSYIGNIAAIGKESRGDEAAFSRIYAAYSEQDFKLKAVTLQDKSSTKAMTYQSIGFLAMFMMFSAVNMTEIILKEKENRTFLRLLSSPISARTYVFSNVIVNFMIMLLQIVVTLIMMKNVFHIDSGITYGQLILSLLLFALAAIGLSLLIVAFANSTAGAGAMQNLIITPSCLLAGCFFPMDIMPDTVRKISNFLPQHWLLDMINKLQQGHSLGSLYVNMAILIAFAAVFSLIAIYRFSRNNDVRQFV